jgi:hypothetical protein
VNDKLIASDRIAVRMETSPRGSCSPGKSGAVCRREELGGIEGGPVGRRRVWIERMVSRISAPRQMTIRPGDAALTDARTPIECASQ